MEDDIDKVVAVVDGAYSAGIGGWATMLGKELLSGWLPDVTNNQMELYAILVAVQNCPTDITLEIITDSKLAIGWLAWGYAIRVRQIAVLVGLIHEIARLRGVTMVFTKVKGHKDHMDNILVDRAAVEQRKIGYSAIYDKP